MLVVTAYHENQLFPTAFVKSSDRNSLCCACDGCKDRSCDAFFMLAIKTCHAAKAVSTWMDYDRAG